MTIYQSRKSQPLKWIFALIIFGLAMSFTTADVYGVGATVQDHSGNAGQGADFHDNTTPPDDGGNDGGMSPSAVPEPMTLILVSSGLGALYLSRRRRK